MVQGIHRSESGATLVEMITILVIMGIVSAVVISRVMNVEQLEATPHLNTIRNHILYAQVMAMKRNDTTWGVKCDTIAYWVFKTDSPDVITEPDDTNNIIYLPGNEVKKIAVSDMGGFTLYFDQFGIPHTYVTNKIVPITASVSIQIGSLNLTVSPETGFIE